MIDRRSITERTLRILDKLPLEKIEEISRYAKSKLKHYEEQLITSAIQQLAEAGGSYAFLEQEEGLYTEEDLLERYDVQG